MPLSDTPIPAMLQFTKRVHLARKIMSCTCINGYKHLSQAGYISLDNWIMSH